MSALTFLKIVPRIYKPNTFIFRAKHLTCSKQILGNKFWEKDLPITSNYHPLLQNRLQTYCKKMQEPENKKLDESEKDSTQVESSSLSLRQKLQRAVAEYGTIVIVFHVGFAMICLGTLYLIVSSGVDMQAFLSKFLSAEASNKIAANAGTFALAYAIHKLMSPIRIVITLTAAPFIVKYLRRIGFLKVKKG